MQDNVTYKIRFPVIQWYKHLQPIIRIFTDLDSKAEFLEMNNSLTKPSQIK